MLDRNHRTIRLVYDIAKFLVSNMHTEISGFEVI